MAFMVTIQQGFLAITEFPYKMRLNWRLKRCLWPIIMLEAIHTPANDLDWNGYATVEPKSKNFHINFNLDIANCGFI